MKLIFLGTRGNIKHRSRLHARHSALLVSYYGKKVMVDCGEDWLGRFDDFGMDAIFVTHAHPDHAFGLRSGSPCPVYASRDAWNIMKKFPIRGKRTVLNREKISVSGIIFEAFRVVHSLRAPALGYRITAGHCSVFYAPDIVYIDEREDALSGINLYIGDGATVTRPLVRKKNGKLFGHTTLSAQLTWCMKEGVRRAVFTHCGSEIVQSDQRKLKSKIKEIGGERNVNSEIAHDGMEIILR
jgi:ribonuclease BN (tRNA processing enzyme)